MCLLWKLPKTNLVNLYRLFPFGMNISSMMIFMKGHWLQRQKFTTLFTAYIYYAINNSCHIARVSIHRTQRENIVQHSPRLWRPSVPAILQNNRVLLYAAVRTKTVVRNVRYMYRTLVANYSKPAFFFGKVRVCGRNSNYLFIVNPRYFKSVSLGKV